MQQKIEQESSIEYGISVLVDNVEMDKETKQLNLAMSKLQFDLNN